MLTEIYFTPDGRLPREEVSFVSFVAPKVLRVMFLLAAWKKKFVSFVKFVVEKTSET